VRRLGEAQRLHAVFRLAETLEMWVGAEGRAEAGTNDGAVTITGRQIGCVSSTQGTGGPG